MKSENARKQEIDEIITKLMNRRKNMCRFEAVESGEYDILVSDHPEEIKRIDDAVERIEPLRDIIDGQLQFIQPGCGPLKAEAAQRRIDDALVEAREIELWLNPITIGCDSLKPIPNVSESMMLDWAEEELWPKTIAISRVVSSKYRDINLIMATMRGLLARLARPKGSGEKKSWEESVGAFERDGVTYVRPMAWLKWCDEKGFPASPILWDAVNTYTRVNKGDVLHETHPELSIDAIAQLAEMDADLYPSPYDAGLFGELDERLGRLVEDGYKPEMASKILHELIQKGQLLKEIAVRPGKVVYSSG